MRIYLGAGRGKVLRGYGPADGPPLLQDGDAHERTPQGEAEKTLLRIEESRK